MLGLIIRKNHIIKPIFIAILTAYITCFSGSLMAQTNQEIIDNQINQQDWIMRQQQNQIEEQRRISQEEAIKKERERRKKEQEEEEKEKAKNLRKSAKCFPIKSITLVNTKSISNSEKKKLTKSFIGDCINAKILTNVINKIQNYYHDQGYIIARAFVPKQNIQGGNIKIKVYEGTIGEIKINDNKFANKMQKITAFGFIEDEVFNINDINQGIYQMNRLSSNDAKMKIEPGKEDTKISVLISNKNKFPAKASIAYDNLGNDFTGIKRSTFSGNLDNILSLNDAINLSYTTNLNDDSREKELKSFSTGISIPFAYNTISYDYSKTQFRGTNQGQNSTTRLTGYSNRNNITLDRVLLSKGNLRIAGNTSLTIKDSASYVNQQKIETSQRKLTIANVGFNVSNYFKNGINLYLNPSYSQGLKLLNAKQDEQGLAADNARAQFQLLKFYGNISKRFTIPKIKIPIALSTQMSGQISKHTLFGSEQFSVGGYHSVRGFRENFIVGDSGYYFRNKANLNLGSVILPLIKTKSNKSYLYNLNKFSIEPFYDYGYAKTKYNGDSGRLSGAGIKTIFNSKYFTASLTYSWGVSKSSLITSGEKENKMLFFELSAGCC